MADVSVRPAAGEDAEEIARIQLEAWRIGYVDVLPAAVLEGLDAGAIARSWHGATVAPPSGRHHVLLALEGEHRVGFAAFGPDPDLQPDDPSPEATAAISILLVEPRWGRRGHGSRLLAAIADLARADNVSRLVAWAPAAHHPTLEFYRSAGWEPDGLQRTLDTGAGEVNELRLHTSL